MTTGPARDRSRRAALLCLLVALLIPGCAARTLDDLSASYERLTVDASQAEANRRMTANASGDSMIVPPGANLGPAFATISREALKAAQNVRQSDLETRIAFYRLAASSAHFALIEEARAGPGAPGGGAATLLNEAQSRGSEACAQLKAPPQRDCAYLAMAGPLATLAASSEAWRLIKPQDGVTQPDRVRAVLDERAGDADFDAQLAGYQAGRQKAVSLAPIGASAAGSAAVQRGGSVMDFLQVNDARVACLARKRSDLARWAANRGQPPARIDRPQASATAAAAERRYAETYGGTVQCGTG
ncbi:MAG: hypothetical protein AB7F22_24660 [Reyranella sp.]|uniref:hypothetical protein n=1 Tax=Reyranella sp. TaxID=1929291 RepID=UPI003D1219AD